MPVRSLKPVTPSQRYRTISTFEEITKKTPERSLTENLSKTGGRNNHGRITSRRRGGGHKRRYRIIDFKRNKYDIEAKVVGIEYDPNRSSRIALLLYSDGEKKYIIAPEGLTDGDTVMSSQGKIPFNGLKYGFNSKFDYNISNIKSSKKGFVFDIKTPTNKFKSVFFNQIGNHNLSNALCAITLADQVGLNMKNVLKSLSNFSGVKRRM